MNIIELQGLRDWFENYAGEFCAKAENEKDKNSHLIKKEHSERVYDNALEIGKSLSLNEGMLHTAGAIGLLHDIGRFEQYKQFHTFKDSESKDHGDMGADVLVETNVLKAFDRHTAMNILTGVRYHNKKYIPADLDDERLLLVKIIRDADKLDIYEVFRQTYVQEDINRTLVWDMPDTPGITKEVAEAVLAGQMVDIKSLNNVNDFKVLKISWLFDINFNNVRHRHQRLV